MRKKSFKSSFTLVELSIVLVVLSLLVGGLTVGRKIVDRAQIQRVIFEIDYYKKSLSLFKDTYDAYPGNLDKANCIKYGEFSQINATQTGIEIGDYCETDRTKERARTTDGYVSSGVIATTQNWTTFLNTMRFMKTAGLIDNVNTTIEQSELVNGNYTNASDASAKGPWNVACKDCISYENVKRTQAYTSFDKEGVVTLAGITLSNDTNQTSSYDLNFIRGSNNSLKVSRGHELYNTNYANQINSQNVLFLYRNVPSDADDTFGSSSISTGLFSSSLTNQIDAKLDDGMPGSGILLALKSGYAHQSSSNEDIQKSVCYYETFENVGSAYYNNNNDVKYGCNVAYILK